MLTFPSNNSHCHIILDEFPLTRRSIYGINLVMYYGAHYGTTLKTWLGEIVASKMDGKPDATFWEVGCHGYSREIETASTLGYKVIQ